MDPAITECVSVLAEENPVVFHQVTVQKVENHAELVLDESNLTCMLRIQPHQLCLIPINQPDTKESPLIEPTTIFVIPYELEMQIELLRHVSTHLVLVGKSSGVKLLLDFASNTDRDIVAMLLRGFLTKFHDRPGEISASSEREFYEQKERLWQ